MHIALSLGNQIALNRSMSPLDIASKNSAFSCKTSAFSYARYGIRASKDGRISLFRKINTIIKEINRSNELQLRQRFH